MESTLRHHSKDSVRKFEPSSNVHAIARGAFSEQMLRPTESVCSMASSPSGFEYIPDRAMDSHHSSSHWIPSPSRPTTTAAVQEPKQQARMASEKWSSLTREVPPRSTTAHNGEDEIDFPAPRPAAPINLPTHIGLNPVPGMNMNVHPVEVLTKKLREQATELTHAYEEIEKKNAVIAEYKAQVHEQQQTIDRRQIGSASPAGNATRCSGKSVTTERARQRKLSDRFALSNAKKSDELNKKIAEAEQEKKKFELATKRIEKTLVEVQVFRNEYDPSLHPKKTTKGNGVVKERDQDALTAEQQHYIRVLEEVVHLKASELQIAGHEELLMVLAELRHTIYQQEQELAQKADSLQEYQRLLDEQRSASLALEKQLESNTEAREQEQQTHHVLEDKLSRELDQLRRQLRQEQERCHQLKVNSDTTQHNLEEMQGKWIEATQIRSLLESKHEEQVRQCETLQAQLDEVKSKCEQTAVHAAGLEEQGLKREVYMNELKSVQDDLLQTIDSHAKKAHDFKSLIKRLRAQVLDLTEREQLVVKQSRETAQTQEREMIRLSDQISELQQQLKSLETLNGTLVDRNAKLETQNAQQTKSMNALIQERAFQEEAESLQASKQGRKWNEMHEALTEMQAAMQLSLGMMAARSAINSREDAAHDTEESHSADETAEFSSDLVDQDKLAAMRACCRSIDYLVSEQEKLSRHFDSYLPSFGELMQQILDVSMAAFDHVESISASWARERCDLMLTSKALESTSRICQRSMEKSHATTLQSQNALAEASKELEKQNLRAQDLESELDDAYSEMHQLHGVQEQLAAQERAVAVHQDRLEQLATQNQELVALNTTYILERAALDQQIQLMNTNIQALENYEHRVQELEQDMLQASQVMEQQNDWAKQLQLELEEREHEHDSLADQLSSLTARDHAISSSFCQLFRQYMACVRRSKDAISSNDAPGKLSGTVFEQEEERGDLLRMMQVFPALVEEYISAVAPSTITDAKRAATAHQPAPARHDGKARRHRYLTSGVDLSKETEPGEENLDRLFRYCQPTPPRRSSSFGTARLSYSTTEMPKATVRAIENEDIEFTKQLQLVQSAFQQYQ